MEFIKKYKDVIVFHALLNIVILFCITFSSYYHTPLSEAKDYLFYGIHIGLIQFSTFGFVYFLTLNRYIFKILFSILFVIYSVIAFWAYSLDISFSDGILNATLDTTPDVVFDLLNWQLILYVLSCIVVLYYVQKRYIKIRPLNFNIYFLVIAIFGISSFFIVESKRQGTLKSRLPFNVFFEIQNYFSNTPIDIDVVDFKVESKTKDLKIYLVLGESVRADHLFLNGYKRNTTPLLCKQSNLISFKNTYTQYTYTAVSLPQILTNQSVYDTIIKPNYSLVDIFNKAKINTYWFGNQTPEKSYLHFIDSSKTKAFADPIHSVYSFKKATDLKLLEFSPSESDSNSFVIYHMMGSHWFYENRYTSNFRVYEPTIKSKYIPSNTDQEMINSYDNTIVLMDYFVDSLINRVKNNNEKALIIYLSDHGELLGENGKWLHAQVGDEVGPTNPAFLVWYSNQYLNEYPKKVEFLTNHKDKNIPLDYIFHTLIDAFEIDNDMFNEKQSLFRSYKKK